MGLEEGGGQAINCQRIDSGPYSIGQIGIAEETESLDFYP
jgi:hypothetical protein